VLLIGEDMSGIDYFQKPGDHADEMETSSIMAIRPDLVLPLILRKR
jgi:hypothetical protein